MQRDPSDHPQPRPQPRPQPHPKLSASPRLREHLRERRRPARPGGGGEPSLARSLGALKQALNRSERFGDVIERFFDAVDADPRLMTDGLACRPELVIAAVREVGRQLTGPGSTLTDDCWAHLPEHGFIHGAGLVGGKPAVAIYFEELGRGMIAVTLQDSGDMVFARFTVCGEVPAADPERN